jgi:hypothetical protein
MSEGRSARVSPAGAAVFLTADDLVALGINPETAQQLQYRVVDGDLSLEGDS